MSSSSSQLWTCARCLRAQRLRGPSLDGGSNSIPRRPHPRRHPFSTTAVRYDDGPAAPKSANPHAPKSAEGQDGEEQQGAMSRRLAEMAEETMDTGSKSDRKLMQDAGFSEELKMQLEERIAQTSFAAQNQQAASQVTMPNAAGKGTRDIAGAEPWRGTETMHDSVLRMLDDSHKKLRSPSRAPSIAPKVNLRPAPKKNISAADRLARARDKTSIYAISQQSDMTEQEREKWRRELKDRFSPGARPMPTSITGLTSLANERIEDAIARGQFKNISRGKGINVERDYNANSPFLDTTEYFMNKIIQKQEIVPPWIEKQQELVKAVATFRSRLRSDWRRHAARTISSRGGTVEDQVRRAQGYALAEERVNPRPARRVENLSSISSDGRLTTVSVEERIAAGVAVEPRDEQEQIEIKVTEQPAENAPIAVDLSTDAPPPPPPTAAEEAAPPEIISTLSEQAPAPTPTPSPSQSQSQPSPPPSSTSAQVLPMPYPFRDPTWEKSELAYHTLAVANLNALTRSYNLMAPKIAQKPYYTLDRELRRCFADVAPQLADEIRERSTRPLPKVRVVRQKVQGGVLEKLGGDEWMGHEGTIRDESGEKSYGFKQFWRDLFGGAQKQSLGGRGKRHLV
ncbi:uncharacterized protein Z520_03984 [Fonsecaea multimorphosa CBS 102226]|uniref:DnaJ homologue subfamily C member 28 conserved domain-containing protein n=1 Tax=Fonsecaea multimorphosa CBS 102226 TaxID=1442371 RepID=A0A0D2KU72_9EURO|nr:uncharacterized protein Z520_03984 [Fonsecaea multimorphosa CBS 102226]KIY00299.1 hypothetical protein Z520_03984 [Fonsecaea multimorphosa CBS 102226]OAL27132.1 hypothetical protein AYO22_03763 [Fonsecaea multimorphosa]